MAEHDSDRDERGDREPEEQNVPFDEAAAWEAIVAGYGEEPPDPAGVKPFKPVEDLALPESGTNDGPGSPAGGTEVTAERSERDGAQGAGGIREFPEGEETEETEEDRPVRPLGGSVAFAPGVGPRDYHLPEPVEEDLDETDEGHFVPPEPPPLPAADTTARFAWLGVLGGPVLLLVAVLLGWEMTWWLATLGIGGFLGGFTTLVARMRTDDEDDEDPGRGAVV